MIKVKDVFLKYPKAANDTIQGISFDVHNGEIFGFLGPSGAGKSTMQKILTGVLNNYRGSVNVFGTEMKNRTNDYYEKIGVDFEFPNFYSKFTALENLNYFGGLYSVKTANPMLLLEKMGLEKDAGKKVGSFSKGMKMRLGFVRAILHDPQLLFLDEPTSGLDPANARILKDMVIQQKAMGKTVILTTHNMHDAEELCDRVAFIVDGKVKAIGSPHALREQGACTQVAYRYTANGKEINSEFPLAGLGESKEFQAALKMGTLKSIHSQERTLEDIFIEMTGRCLL